MEVLIEGLIEVFGEIFLEIIAALIGTFFDYLNENSKVTLTTNHTLYAKWNAKPYTIDYSMNNGTKGSSAPTTGTVDVDVKTQSVSPLLIKMQIGDVNIESWGLYTMGLDETQEILNAKEQTEEVV